MSVCLSACLCLFVCIFFNLCFFFFSVHFLLLDCLFLLTILVTCYHCFCCCCCCCCCYCCCCCCCCCCSLFVCFLELLVFSPCSTFSATSVNSMLLLLLFVFLQSHILQGFHTFTYLFISSLMLHVSSSQPMFYHLGHFSKFVPPGSRRISVQSSQQTSLQFVSFSCPDSTTVLVILNSEDKDVSVQVKDVKNAEFTATIPASSIQTYMWS